MAATPVVRAVLVGCGGMSREWLNAAKQISDLQIVGLVDIVEEMAQKRAAEYELYHVVVGSDLTAVLNKTQPDVIFNCTIPEAHVSVAIEALAHGCHVLGEKPLADSMTHAHVILEAARRAHKTYAVTQNRRYHAGTRRLQAFLKTETLGPLTTVNSDFYLAPHFGGFREQMRHVLLLDMAIHTFDAARFLTGADPLAVYCKEWNPAGSWYRHDASAIAIFEMTNGIVYTYRGSWCAEGLPTSWQASWRIVGRNGSVLWDGNENMQAQIVAQPGGFITKYQDVAIAPYTSSEDTNGHLSLLREFLLCLQTGEIPETIADDNIKSLAMVFGAIESAETGKRVSITW